MIIFAHLVQPDFHAFCTSCGILLWLGREWSSSSFFYPPSDFPFVALQKYVGLFAKPNPWFLAASSDDFQETSELSHILQHHEGFSLKTYCS